MNDTSEEIASQPAIWERGLALAAPARRELAAPGERMLILGCGTSWFVAQCIAELRESAGFGETDAICASEYVPRRRYDRVVAITRSGTSTEVLDALRQVPEGTHRVAITAVSGEAVDTLAETRLLLDFADERSVVQTRFPTTVLAMARAAFGEDLSHLIADGRAALDAPLPAGAADIDHLVFLGTGWTIGLAHEAALKMRESSQFWTESYPAMEYRHGPISIAAPGRAVWALGPLVPHFSRDVAATGAHLQHTDRDALAELVMVHRLCLLRAADRGLDPASPRNLTRSIILDS